MRITPRRILKYGILLTVFGCLYHLASRSKSGHYPDPNFIPNLALVGPEQQDWQPVTGSDFKFTVYSAYSFVDHDPPKVLVIGIAKKRTRDKVFCEFYYREEGATDWMDIAVLGTVETLMSGSGGFYTGVFIRCPIPNPNPGGKTLRPAMVSVVVNDEMKVSNIIRIQYGNESQDVPYKYNFSVCVKPTFNFNTTLPLLEWIEFYKLMGVEQFTLYNISIGPEASCVLNHLAKGYDNSIKLNVFPWHSHQVRNQNELPFSATDNIQEYEIAAAQNDCVYRNRGHRSKYLVFVDFDKFLMPREDKAKNYQEMIDILDSQNRKMNIGEYQFKNTFYCLSPAVNKRLLKRCSNFLESSLKHRICLESLLMKSDRRKFYHPFKVGTKYIIKPKGVQQTSSYFVNRFEEGYSSVHVPKDIAASRHYRYFEGGCGSEKDGIREEFGLKLLENLSNRVESLRKVCNFTLSRND